MQAPAMVKRIDHHLNALGVGKENRCQHHGGNRGHRIGLEQIRRHAGAIADIVADIVGDGGGIARIVFGNAGFDLTDHIAADIGALGENAAAETGENGDQRCAEAERDQRIHNHAALDGIGHRRPPSAPVRMA